MKSIPVLLRAFGAAAFALALMPSGASAQSAATSSQSAPTAQDFGRLPFVDMPRLSPDGTRMAGLVDIKGEQRIAVLNLFDKDKKNVLLTIPDKADISDIRWVNDNYVIVTIFAQQPIDGVLFYVSRLVSVDTHTGKAMNLLWQHNGQNGSRVVWVPDDGSNTILLAVQDSIYMGEDFWPTVYRVDVSNGHNSVVQNHRDGVMEWTADAAGQVRSGVIYNDNNRSYRLLYRGESGSMLKVVDRASARKRETLLDPVAYIPGTDDAFVIRDNDDGATGLYETNMLTQDDVRTIFAAPTGQEIGDAIVARDGHTLLAVSTAGPHGTIHWIDPALADLQAAFDRAVPGRSARIVSFSADRKAMLVLVTRPDSPGMLYYFDVADGRLQKIATMNEALGFRPLSPVKAITYKARDGLEIEAILTLPAGRDPHNLPIVVLPHGGPWAHDDLVYDSWAQFIASRGYAVIQPNFRGSDGYGEAFLRKGEGQMGLAMQDDLSDALAWAVSQGIADPKRACIVGASYGGYAAMWGIAKDPEEWRCAISIAGVSSVSREVNSFGDYLQSGLFKDEWKRMSDDFPAVSPINAVDKIHAPLLLIHGDKDARVDVGQSRSMYGKMKSAGKTVEFVELKGADHNFGREVDRVALLQAIESFLARYNPAGVTSAPKAAAVH